MRFGGKEGAYLRPGGGGLRGEDADVLSHAPAILELHESVDQGEQGIVPSQTDVVARLEACAALPNQDRATGDELSAVALHPQALGVAVPAVSRTASGFLMGHPVSSSVLRLSGVNLLDDHRRERLPVTARAPVLFALLLLEDQHLLGLVLLDDAADDPRALQDREADLKPALGLQRQDLVERHLVADPGGDFFDPDPIADGDLVLLASGGYDGVAHTRSSFPWMDRSLYWPLDDTVNAQSAPRIPRPPGRDASRRGDFEPRHAEEQCLAFPARASMSHDAAPPASAVRHGAVALLARLRDPRAVLVFMLAYAVRIVYVLQIRHIPYFDVPLIDGPNYFRMATAIASGSLGGGHEAFWQPPLYSYFLALLFVTVGTRMAAIYAVQAAPPHDGASGSVRPGRRAAGSRRRGPQLHGGRRHRAHLEQWRHQLLHRQQPRLRPDHPPAARRGIRASGAGAGKPRDRKGLRPIALLRRARLAIPARLSRGGAAPLRPQSQGSHRGAGDPAQSGSIRLPARIVPVLPPAVAFRSVVSVRHHGAPRFRRSSDGLARRRRPA